VFTAEELTNMMHRCKPGTKVSLRYRRYSTIYDTFVIIGNEMTRNGQTPYLPLRKGRVAA
jgi:hypothetical protein